MIRKVVRAILTLIGLSMGVTVFFYSRQNFDFATEGFVTEVALISAFAFIGGGIFFILEPFFSSEVSRMVAKIEKEFSKFTISDILTSLMGLITGLIISYFISGLLQKIPVVGLTVSALVYIMLGYMGASIAIKRKEDLAGLFRRNFVKQEKELNERRNALKGEFLSPKVLDTSVIIDGRIADIAKIGFIEGKLIVPEFVLEELRHIADSSDDLKRAKGRRGLDILNTMQEELGFSFEISERDFQGVKEVDVKLLKLAENLNGVVLTNDYNLNKVAQFQGVKVLNINELANAVKPVLLPGEELTVTIVKEGKELNQGVAYLDDGTMIVVEGAKRMVGEQRDVIVTSVLQTAAGRMIFAKVK